MLQGNPFFHRGPIRSSDAFFGRAHELRQALTMLNGGQCISIVGPRRIGKTSLLLQLMRQISEQPIADGRPQLRLLYIDCECCGLHTPAELLSLMARELIRSVASEVQTLALPPRGTTISYDEFEELVRLVSEHRLQPVFLLDEFDLFECHEHRAGANRDEVEATAIEHFVADAEMHWLYFWHTLSTHDRHLLALLPILWRTDQQGVQRLHEAALVTRKNGEVVVFSAAFQRFVARQRLPGLYQVPPFTLDPHRRIALRRGVLMPLPPAEFALLACLMASPGQLVPAAELEQQVWNDKEALGGERLKATIKSLRRILNDDAASIKNVRGAGYFIVMQDQ